MRPIHYEEYLASNGVLGRTLMSMIRRAALTSAAVLFSALPAAAQTAAPTTDQGGPSLLWVWGWILVVGIIVFIVGTSLGVRGGR